MSGGTLLALNSIAGNFVPPYTKNEVHSNLKESRQTLTTKRLALRPIEAKDFGILRELYRDEDVMKLISSGPRDDTKTGESLDRFLRFWDENNFGVYIVERRSDQKCVGYCGLRFLEGTRDLEIGGIFAKAYWNDGVGTEAARACLAYAFDHLLAPKVLSVILPEHAASQRLLEKLEFQQVGEIFVLGATHLLFELTRARFRN